MFDNKASNILEKARESRIFADEELQPYLFGKRLWKELAEDSETLGITGAGEGWQLKEGYDAYYYPHNQRAGSIHYCYYFDGMLEMLVTFPANHCGQNCVYIYKQNAGEVSPLADTIAVCEKYVCFGTDYKKLSPYLDIELLDAYVDENGVYWYLSLDNSSFGGDSKGGIYTLSLYETILEQGAEPKELVRIEENWQEEQRKMYFIGEQVYELGALRELPAAYMDGYTKQEICYQTAGEMFPRDIVAWSDAQKRQELEILYDALLTVLNGPYPAKTAISSTIDYTMLEAEGYEILNENICVDPKPVSEDSWLAEQLADIIETFDKDRNNIADYFLFDLNNDGMEEYIVSVCAPGWTGSSGNHVEILSRKEDGSSDRIFHVTVELYFDEGEYNPLAVLQETAGGYYKIVLPYSVML
ncbi:MAG: hypothetical protein K2N90_07160 [Lachnospiraceae bacterium]|nr:hypothetical protein [Lachnospiraceae bacterium]